MKKYIVNYSHIATGYGWRREYGTVAEFEDFVNEMRGDAMATVSVWDADLQKCIFRKGYGYKPEIDMLGNPNRDLRTTTRERKHA